MSDILLVLGPVAFQDFEVPSGINFGGRQTLAVHHLPGGTRIIDAVGRDDSLISFNGIFTGSDATLRARALDTLRVAGIPLQLTWDVFFYTVLIAEFSADYQNGWWIPYRIACVVVQDEASIVLSLAQSLTATTLADIGSASGLAATVGVNLSALGATMAMPNATIRGTDSYGAASIELANARSMLNASICTADTTINNCNLATSGSAQDGARNLLLGTAAVGQLSASTLADSYLARAALNLNNAST